VLKEIDLTHKVLERDDEWEQGKLSVSFVLPILDSIINTPGNSLTLVRFPKQWRYRSPAVLSFLLDYNRHLESRQVRCSKCTVGLWGSYIGTKGWINGVNRHHGDDLYNNHCMQNHTCIKCTKFFCYECDNGVDGKLMLQTCIDCKEEYCYNCAPMTECVQCSENVCNDCRVRCPYSSSGCEYTVCAFCSGDSFMVCDTCGDKGCGEWCTGPGFFVCDGDDCNKVQCEGCRDEPGGVKWCDSCNASSCADCRYSKLSKDWGNACSECIELIAGELGQKILKDKQIYTNLKNMKCCVWI